MATPTFAEWRNLSNTNKGMASRTIKTRQLQALATIVSGQNPDGTTRGS